MILIETILLLVVFRIAELIIVLHSAFVLQRCSGFVLGYSLFAITIVSYSCLLLRSHIYSTCKVRRDHKGEDLGHEDNSSHSSSLRWQTAKHALRCLIGCNIGEGVGDAIVFTLGLDKFPRS